jgi:SAM-dependent methyltransferase
MVMDLESGDPLPFPAESFDLVLIIHFLHRPLFAEAKRVTKRGGAVIAAIHTAAKHRFLVAPGELRTFFEDWTLIDREGGGVAEVIARKP